MYLQKKELPMILDTTDFESNGGKLEEHPLLLNGQYELIDGEMPKEKVLVNIVPEGEMPK